MFGKPSVRKAIAVGTVCFHSLRLARWTCAADSRKRQRADNGGASCGSHTNAGAKCGSHS